MFSVEAPHLTDKFHEFHCRKGFVENGIFWNITYLFLYFEGVASKVLTENFYFTAKIGNEAAKDFHGSGFSCAVGTDVSNNLARSDLQVDPFQDLFFPVFLLKVANADNCLMIHYLLGF